MLDYEDMPSCRDGVGVGSSLLLWWVVKGYLLRIPMLRLKIVIKS